MNDIASENYEGTNNQEYWNERSKEQSDAKWKELGAVEKELQKQYLIALDEIQKDLADFYSKYANENAISYQDAMKEMNNFEIGNFAQRMNQLRQQAQLTNNPFVIAEMEKLFKGTQMVRLQTLMAQIDAKLLLMGYTQQLTMETWLADVYETTYYQTAFSLYEGGAAVGVATGAVVVTTTTTGAGVVGAGVVFGKLNENVIKEAITYPWAGAMFSDRIWDNKTKLVNELRQTITTGLTTGKSVQKMSRELRDKMDSSYSNALRLVRTETGAVMNEATAKGYEAGGLDSYQFLGTLDNRTSKVCQQMDGKVFKLADKQVGKNFPPLHVSCRSTISPWFQGIEQGTRISKLADGTTEYVQNMNYEEWYRKYVK